MHTPLYDTTLSVEERLDWLLGEMTMDEKLRCLATTAPAIERLGIPGFSLGGEAAHGVENRNDQNDYGEPDVTTSFVQPIGMSATWDPDLIREAGEVTGTEARVVFHRHPRGGLSRWAPTVDLERDPRWGRTEEGYGEDPLLTGVMASAYIRGMQGDDPEHLRVAATLKHFYANNTEIGRGYKSSSVDPRNRYELYLEPFRRCICDGHAEAVMTAYNRINGTPGILNPEVRTLLKGQYGLHHAVSDGGAMGLCTRMHHYFGTDAETLAGALKAGVDAIAESPEAVEKAAREAFELGLITPEEIDGALRNAFRTRLRLGLFDQEDPYDRVTEADIDSLEHRALSRRVAQEAVVLLKNENAALPLSAETADTIALIGPLADAWDPDWYGGMPPYRTTLREGMERALGQSAAGEAASQETPECGSAPGLLYFDGYDRVVFREPDHPDRGIAVSDDGSLRLTGQPDTFLLQDWGCGSILLRCERTGKYLNLGMTPAQDAQGREIFPLRADSDSPFGWFVTELVHLHDAGNGRITLSTSRDMPVFVGDDDALVSRQGQAAAEFAMETVQSGIARACELAKACGTVVLALGCNPVINAKEEIDRSTIALPPAQEALMQRVFEANPNVILVLFSNYPYSICWAQEHIPAILWSATGSQDMGAAMSDVLFGKTAPAGRLNMTWYRSDDQLPDIDDYDIIKGERTYRYFRGEVLYPFGHGLTYTSFSYSGLRAELEDPSGAVSAGPAQNASTARPPEVSPAGISEPAQAACGSGPDLRIRVSFDVTNTGDAVSDEVAQIYGKAPLSRVKKPLLQLLGFRRLKDVRPGETRHVELLIPVQELRFYDTVSGTLMVEEGEYQIFAGRSSVNLPLQAPLRIPGAHTGRRILNAGRHRADHYDDYENVLLTEGHFGYTAAAPKDDAQAGILCYRDCELPPGIRALWLHMKSQHGCSVELLIDDMPAGSWSGDTRAYTAEPRFLFDDRARREEACVQANRRAVYTDVRIALEKLPGIGTTECAEVSGQTHMLKIKMSGDIRLCFFRAE